MDSFEKLLFHTRNTFGYFVPRGDRFKKKKIFQNYKTGLPVDALSATWLWPYFWAKFFFSSSFITP